MIKSKQYLHWLTADTLMLFTSQVRNFATPILILTMGGSATDAATLAAFSQVIVVIFVLAGGMIIDKYNRRLVMFISQALSIAFFLAFVLCIITVGYNLPIFYLLTAALAIRSSLLGSVTDVMLPSVVSDKELTDALSANQARDNIVKMISSPISAAFLAISNVVPYVFGVVGNVIAMLATLGLEKDIPAKAKQNKAEHNNAWQRALSKFKDATIGARIVSYNKVMIFITIISTLSFPFISGIITMLLYNITQ